MSSSIVLTSIAKLVISSFTDFDAIVFVSLFISCTRKSNFFPIGSFVSNKFLNCDTWLLSLVNSSSIEHLSAYITISCASLVSSTTGVFNISLILSLNFTT